MTLAAIIVSRETAELLSVVAMFLAAVIALSLFAFRVRP
jgi:hypothetical protein